MITKEGRDLPISEVTAENYIVPKGEEMFYHCKIEVKQFDPKTGKRISTPRVQKFGAKIYKSAVYDSLRDQGYEVEVLHSPDDWIKEQRERAAERAAQAEETETERKAAERAALKAEILEELKAAGIVAGDEEKKKPGRPTKA